jgi:hypothetical protein
MSLKIRAIFQDPSLGAHPPRHDDVGGLGIFKLCARTTKSLRESPKLVTLLKCNKKFEEIERPPTMPSIVPNDQGDFQMCLLSSEVLSSRNLEQDCNPVAFSLAASTGCTAQVVVIHTDQDRRAVASTNTTVK